MIHNLLISFFLVLGSLTWTKFVCKPDSIGTFIKCIAQSLMRIDSILTIISSLCRKTCKKCIMKFHFRNIEVQNLYDTLDKSPQYIISIVRMEHTVFYIPNALTWPNNICSYCYVSTNSPLRILRVRLGELWWTWNIHRSQPYLFSSSTKVLVLGAIFCALELTF